MGLSGHYDDISETVLNKGILKNTSVHKKIGKCSKILNTLLFPFSKKMLFFMVGKEKRTTKHAKNYNSLTLIYCSMNL